MRVAGLFAGIGGFELGLHRAGHRAELLCDILPAARAVLEARFPDVEYRDDITRLRSLPATVDLVCAGFPCQDLSQAGRTAGLAGDKSSLVGDVFRLLEKRRVAHVVLENVPFMLQLAGGNAMRAIVEEFERLGYRWAYRTVDSRHARYRASTLSHGRVRARLLLARPRLPARRCRRTHQRELLDRKDRAEQAAGRTQGKSDPGARMERRSRLGVRSG